MRKHGCYEADPFRDHGKPLENGRLHNEWADFLHFQNLVKFTSLTLHFLVYTFSYSVDIIGASLWHSRDLEAIAYNSTNI
jgi:hypothetical protein